MDTVGIGDTRGMRSTGGTRGMRVKELQGIHGGEQYKCMNIYRPSLES